MRFVQLCGSMVLSLLLVTACDVGSRELESFRAVPEAQLFYPGSSELGKLDDQGGPGVEGTRVPMTGYRLGSDAAAEDITAWYRAELSSRGWVEQLPPPAPTTDERASYAWGRGDLSFRLGILESSSDELETIYDIRLFASDS